MKTNILHHTTSTLAHQTQISNKTETISQCILQEYTIYNALPPNKRDSEIAERSLHKTTRTIQSMTYEMYLHRFDVLPLSHTHNGVSSWRHTKKKNEDLWKKEENNRGATQLVAYIITRCVLAIVKLFKSKRSLDLWEGTETQTTNGLD